MNKDINIEIHEAIEACDQVLNHMYASKKYISSAKNWGIFDIIAGGLITSIIKRNKMSNAQHEIDMAKSALVNLKSELSDISEIMDIDINVGIILDVSDIFFDNVFSDIIAQGKINRFRNDLEHAIQKIEFIRDRLISYIN